MALDFLKSSVARLEVNLDRQTYQPGDTINGRVTLQAENEVKVRGGKVSILCQEKYQVRYRTRSGRHGSSTTTTWRTDTREVFSKTLLEEMVIPPHFNQAYDFDWQVAADAFPSLVGKIVKVTWWAKATLDRPKAVDVNAEAGFVVSIPMPGAKTNPIDGLQAGGTSDHREDVDLSLKLPRTDWELGETIEGQLEIQARKDFKLTAIRVELVQTESVPEAEGNSRETSVKVSLAGSTSMTAGQSLSLPFQVEIPPDGLPNLNGVHSEVSWKLAGILARRLAFDYHVVQPLRVYSKA